jgi:hypothetical protein
MQKLQWEHIDGRGNPVPNRLSLQIAQWVVWADEKAATYRDIVAIFGKMNAYAYYRKEME